MRFFSFPLLSFVLPGYFGIKKMSLWGHGWFECGDGEEKGRMDPNEKQDVGRPRQSISAHVTT
jgi:hypothetical protein